MIPLLSYKISHKKYLHGFTTLEMVIVVGLVATLGVLVAAFGRDVFYLGGIAKGSLVVNQDARALLRTITTELRSVSQGSNGSYPIAAVGTSTITFFSDIMGDGNKEQVRYFLSGTDLKKGVIVPTGNPVTYATSSETFSIVASNVRATTTPIFEYYTGVYVATSSTPTIATDIPSIRFITVSFTLDADVARAPVSKTYTTGIMLRNLKDNQ